jgi:hypothetical protein
VLRKEHFEREQGWIRFVASEYGAMRLECSGPFFRELE